jgi:hypothetical protein
VQIERIEVHANMTNETTLAENTSAIYDLLEKSKSVDPELYDRYIRNRAIDEPACTALITMYSVLTVLGALGNILVVSCHKQVFSSLLFHFSNFSKNISLYYFTHRFLLR